MAAPEAADEMDMDAEHAPAPPAVQPMLRSRLSGDVRVQIGLPRTPAPAELLWLPDPGRVRRARRQRVCLMHHGPLRPMLVSRTR
jgi:hypothetical protein